ncbi:MAG: aminoacyl-histidine dipeptidase [Oscillospiraceae bacterium]|nr:aminoacyl-histidine dipeptidase [Oscillospiraceae bacterium]
MRVLANLEPKKVFEYFEDLCAIPHGSGNTKQISDYCVNFAKAHGFSYTQDELNNVIIRKNASKGYEESPTVILQGHLDMVCEKDSTASIDFLKDGLSLSLNGDFVSANGTTLGGDDGIAVAMALSVLDDESALHPPLEVLFTTDEETGMYGAAGLDVSNLKGKILLNIDSEDEGVLTAGCAGGARAEIKKAVAFGERKKTRKIVISGLSGGHSGVEIHKNRHNANKLMAELLSEIPNFELADIAGGAKDNVIPNMCECSLYTDCDLTAITDDFIKQKYISADPNLKIAVSDGEELPVINEADSREIINLICAFPNGVQKMNAQIPTLVQTSLNLGVLKIENGSLVCTFSVRSSVNSEKYELLNELESISKEYGAQFSDHGHYPAWEYRENSHLRDIMIETFEGLYGRKPTVDVIHAGLECGLFCDKIDGLDAVSFGPDLFDIHTPRERLSVSSVQRTYKFLCETLKCLR